MYIVLYSIIGNLQQLDIITKLSVEYSRGINLAGPNAKPGRAWLWPNVFNRTGPVRVFICFYFYFYFCKIFSIFLHLIKKLFKSAKIFVKFIKIYILYNFYIMYNLFNYNIIIYSVKFIKKLQILQKNLLLIF